MANLTIAIDDQLLQAARIKALQQGTSVNEICREAIARFAGGSEAGAEMLAALRELARQMPPTPAGAPVWPGRDALYDEVMRERGLDPPAADSKRTRR